MANVMFLDFSSSLELFDFSENFDTKIVILYQLTITKMKKKIVDFTVQYIQKS